MANHDFSPTANFTFEEPGVFRLRALRDLEAGEEVSGGRPRETDVGSPLKCLLLSSLHAVCDSRHVTPPGLTCKHVRRKVRRLPPMARASLFSERPRGMPLSPKIRPRAFVDKNRRGGGRFSVGRAAGPFGLTWREISDLLRVETPSYFFVLLPPTEQTQATISYGQQLDAEQLMVQYGFPAPSTASVGQVLLDARRLQDDGAGRRAGTGGAGESIDPGSGQGQAEEWGIEQRRTLMDELFFRVQQRFAREAEGDEAAFKAKVEEKRGNMTSEYCFSVCPLLLLIATVGPLLKGSFCFASGL